MKIISIRNFVILVTCIVMALILLLLNDFYSKDSKVSTPINSFNLLTSDPLEKISEPKETIQSANNFQTENLPDARITQRYLPNTQTLTEDQILQKS